MESTSNGPCMNGPDWIQYCGLDQDGDTKKETAERLKEEANKFFKFEQYEKAISLYTQAIELNNETAVYYGNRSIAYLKEELYGAALEDANTAISLDKNYIKGYYRRAAAHMALGHFKEALKNYESVYKVRPRDSDARKNFEQCQKIVRRQAFERAIRSEDQKPIAESIDVQKIEIDSTYTGPRLDADGNVTLEFMKDLIDVFRKQGTLHKRYAYKMVLDIRKMFMEQPTLVDITVPKGQKFTICGDIHGQYYDLLNIFALNGLPSEANPYLFNGDFVDRGSFSVETIFTLIGFKLLYPKHFFMSRGNHESHVMNQMYGFEGEVRAKYAQQMADLFTETFNYLPLCHLINQKVLVMHGGIFKEDGVKLDDIRKENRNRQPPEEGIMCDLLWSDPQELRGRSPSKRGVGCQFGPDITERFLADNQLDYIIRSHEVKPQGYEVNHGGKCITVFSAPNYCDSMGNSGAFITISGDDLTPQFTTYDAVEHPKVKPMAYGNSLFGSLSSMFM